MPVVSVTMLPSDIPKAALEELESAIKDVVAGIPQLKLTRDDVTVRFPADLLPRTGLELVVFVDGLFKKAERTEEVRQWFFDDTREEVVRFALEYVPECKKVEVLPSDYDQKRDGFSLWLKKD